MNQNIIQSSKFAETCNTDLKSLCQPSAQSEVDLNQYALALISCFTSSKKSNSGTESISVTINEPLIISDEADLMTKCNNQRKLTQLRLLDINLTKDFFLMLRQWRL